MNKRKPFYRHRLKRDLVEVISLFLLILLTACGSEWEYADPEAHEKTEQLQQEYNAKLQGSWHREVYALSCLENTPRRRVGGFPRAKCYW